MNITIARQFGSGGSDIGRKLAAQLDMDFLDKEVLEKAAKELNISKEILEKSDEKASFLHSLLQNTQIVSPHMPIPESASPADLLFISQSKIIRSAQNSVIIGRCSDYLLKGKAINIFIYANMNFRTQRVCSVYGLSTEQAEKKILKTDKQRASYYNLYTQQKWGNPLNYDLCINSKIGIEESVEVIKKYISYIYN